MNDARDVNFLNNGQTMVVARGGNNRL